MDFYLFLVAASVTIFTALVTTFCFMYGNSRIQENQIIVSPPSPSSPPSSELSLAKNYEHDVFPSFHGPDVRQSFLSHIIKEFSRKGINSFIDNDIKRSKSIGPELIEAIRGSKIAVILLSKNYASSTWCLNELVEIMRCREELNQIVMTIFYEVDPTDVKKQTGYFGKVFKKTCKGKSKEEVEKWRHVLKEVAQIAGYDSNRDPEAKMIEEIATDISDKLNHSALSRELDNFVGMRSHMIKIGGLLSLESDEVRMIGIWGPPGIGKSTIARVLYNQLSGNFQQSALMVNIRESYPRICLDEGSTQLRLQKQMLSEMLDQKDIEVPHLGIAEARLKNKKVLLVLDDVDRLSQLDALAEKTEWFGSGSRVIITTEDLGVLKAQKINHIYKVDFPSSYEALQIFCKYAFDQKSPKEGFKELAHQVTHRAGYLPLGLKVLGSHFRGKSKEEWKRELPRIERRLDGDIENTLRFSYDALFEEDKNLFLHIACFFNHESFEEVEACLAKSFTDVGQGLRVLAEKSLISITEFGSVKMHDLLVQLGKETTRKQFIHEPRRRPFLVDAEDIREVFGDPLADSRSVIGIDFGFYEFDTSETVIERMSNLQFLKLKGYVATLDIPSKLRFLDWKLCPLTSLTFDINTKFLVKLSLSESKLKRLWEGIKVSTS